MDSGRVRESPLERRYPDGGGGCKRVSGVLRVFESPCGSDARAGLAIETC
jgi:hypothetical protein